MRATCSAYKERTAREKEKVRYEKAERALKERVDKERDKMQRAKQALATEKMEIENRKKELDEQEAKIRNWIKDHHKLQRWQVSTDDMSTTPAVVCFQATIVTLC